MQVGRKWGKTYYFILQRTNTQYFIACLVVTFFANIYLYYEDFFSLTYKCLCILFSLNSKNEYLTDERMKGDNTLEAEMRWNDCLVGEERLGAAPTAARLSDLRWEGWPPLVTVRCWACLPSAGSGSSWEPADGPSWGYRAADGPPSKATETENPPLMPRWSIAAPQAALGPSPAPLLLRPQEALAVAVWAVGIPHHVLGLVLLGISSWASTTLQKKRACRVHLLKCWAQHWLRLRSSHCQ